MFGRGFIARCPYMRNATQKFVNEAPLPFQEAKALCPFVSRNFSSVAAAAEMRDKVENLPGKCPYMQEQNAMKEKKAQKPTDYEALAR